MIKQLTDLTEAIIIASLLFLLMQASVQNFKVDGVSMSTTLAPGEFVAVNKVKYMKLDMARLSRLVPFWDASDRGVVYPFQPNGPERGAIIVFQSPHNANEKYVKRIIGLPGERVSIIDGVTYIDGTRLNEPYLNVKPRSETVEFPALGAGGYFVMGDNRPYSSDSRAWGDNFAVPIEHISGDRLMSYDLPFDIGLFGSAN